MSESLPVPVAVAQELSFRFSKDMAVIVCWDREHNRLDTTTFGQSALDKLHAAELGEVFAKAAGATSAGIVYEDFRLDAAHLKEENDRLRQRIADLEAAP